MRGIIHLAQSLGLAPPTCRGFLLSRQLSDRIALARARAARNKPRFIEIPRERGGSRVLFTEEQLSVLRGGLTAEEYRWKLIREWGEE